MEGKDKMRLSRGKRDDIVSSWRGEMSGSSTNNTRVLLVNPNEMIPPVTPIGLDYIASSLELAGFEVDLIDLCFASSFKRELDSDSEKQ